MGDGFTKLFSDIVDSSIWAEDAETCKVWVTLLALCNADGFVRGSPGWLASKARVSVNVCQQALTKFESPDPLSRTESNEGRRIQSVDRGWQVLNYQYFRNEHQQLSTEPRKVYQREWMRQKRAKDEALRLSTGCQPKSTRANAASASASVYEGKGIGENHVPELEQALAWLADVRKNGADYTEPETRSAFLALSANGWMWGKNSVVDWRSALERQIQTDRQRNTKGTYDNKQRSNPRLEGVCRSKTDFRAIVNRHEKESEARMAQEVAAAGEQASKNPKS